MCLIFPALAPGPVSGGPWEQCHPYGQNCRAVVRQAAFLRPPQVSPVRKPDLTGKWYASLTCPIGSGRYVYRFRQRADGQLTGTSKGVSFGVTGTTGILRSGRIRGGQFSFLEQVSEGYAIEVSGQAEIRDEFLSGSYLNSKSGTRCRLTMRKMRDQGQGPRGGVE